MTIAEARKLRKFIEKGVVDFTDKEASECVTLYPRMKYNGELIPAFTRINWQGSLKMAAADLWDREENNPDNAPSLWEDIQYKDGYRVIPEVITVASAFAEGECGWWTDGKLYRSLIANNVWTPAAYPQGWEVVT